MFLPSSKLVTAQVHALGYKSFKTFILSRTRFDNWMEAVFWIRLNIWVRVLIDIADYFISF